MRSNIQNLYVIINLIISYTIAREMAIAETFLNMSYLNYRILSARTAKPQPWQFCPVNIIRYCMLFVAN